MSVPGSRVGRQAIVLRVDSILETANPVRACVLGQTPGRVWTASRVVEVEAEALLKRGS